MFGRRKTRTLTISWAARQRMNYLIFVSDNYELQHVRTCSHKNVRPIRHPRVTWQPFREVNCYASLREPAFLAGVYGVQIRPLFAHLARLLTRQMGLRAFLPLKTQSGTMLASLATSSRLPCAYSMWPFDSDAPKTHF